MTYDDFTLMTISFLLKMLAAVTAIGMLGVCELIGAWAFGIDIKKAVDNVEKHPMAYAVLVTGHFIGAALVISSTW